MSDYDFESYMKDPELTAGIECFKAEDWKGAFDHYLTSSMNGNPEAQVRLGGLFYYGRGTEADPKKALMWYRKAAVAGNAAAQNEVGVMFHLGNGTQRSDGSRHPPTRDTHRRSTTSAPCTRGGTGSRPTTSRPWSCTPRPRTAEWCRPPTVWHICTTTGTDVRRTSGRPPNYA